MISWHLCIPWNGALVLPHFYRMASWHSCYAVQWYTVLVAVTCYSMEWYPDNFSKGVSGGLESCGNGQNNLRVCIELYKSMTRLIHTIKKKMHYHTDLHLLCPCITDGGKIKRHHHAPSWNYSTYWCQLFTHGGKLIQMNTYSETKKNNNKQTNKQKHRRGYSEFLLPILIKGIRFVKATYPPSPTSTGREWNQQVKNEAVKHCR